MTDSAGETGDSAQPAISRRALLRRAGLSLVAGGVVAGLLPSAPPSYVHAEYDSVDESAGFDSAPIPEEATPYGVWHYKAVDGEMRATAPINVVCPLTETTFDELTAVFRRAGLMGQPLEYVRYAWDRDAERYRRQQWTAAETLAGISRRFHVRCWELAGTASIQAHVDTAATPKHGIHTYTRARDAVERIFREAGWKVESASLRFDNRKGPDHDGYVTEVRG